MCLNRALKYNAIHNKVIIANHTVLGICNEA